MPILRSLVQSLELALHEQLPPKVSNNVYGQWLLWWCAGEESYRCSQCHADQLDCIQISVFLLYLRLIDVAINRWQVLLVDNLTVRMSVMDHCDGNRIQPKNASTSFHLMLTFSFSEIDSQTYRLCTDCGYTNQVNLGWIMVSCAWPLLLLPAVRPRAPQLVRPTTAFQQLCSLASCCSAGGCPWYPAQVMISNVWATPAFN